MRKPDQKNKDQHVFTRRAFMIGALQFGMLGVIGGRLAYLQIAEGKRYKMLSDKNRIHTKIIPPSRGEILDRHGNPLATNAQNFRVLMTPEQTEDIETILKKLSNLIDLNDLDIQRAVQAASRIPKFSSVQVRDDLSWEDVSKIEVNLPDLSGLRIDVAERRHYPLGEATAHLTGYVGAVNQEEIHKDPLFSLPDFKIGRTGLEKKFDDQLRGKAGTAQVEVNVIGREVRELSRWESQDGETMVLSIDANLQSFVQDRLEKETSASAVIMDCHSGAVYACASGPAFDPNIFTRPLPADVWEGMLANPGYPLTNKAVAGQYPPGSTFKMVTALALLEAGAANASTRVFCPGHYEYGSDRFHCWKRGGHGSVNMVDALSESCDVYFYKLATEIGIEKIAETARKLGLGQSYNFDLPEERSGLIPDKAWKMGNMGKRWSPGDTIISSIGQGAILTTPLQLAVMTARMTNGGYAVTPWMTGQHQNKPAFEKLGFRDDYLSLVQQGMQEAVNARTGTAIGSRIAEAGMGMAGKTGTAQVKRITMQQRLAGVKNEDLPWEHRHHALFVGYAPYENPRYSCAVVVEHGVSGSSSAAPLARDILLKAQELNPSKTALFTPDKKPENGSQEAG